MVSWASKASRLAPAMSPRRGAVVRLRLIGGLASPVVTASPDLFRLPGMGGLHSKVGLVTRSLVASPALCPSVRVRLVLRGLVLRGLEWRGARIRSARSQAKARARQVPASAKGSLAHRPAMASQRAHARQLSQRSPPSQPSYARPPSQRGPPSQPRLPSQPSHARPPIRGSCPSHGSRSLRREFAQRGRGWQGSRSGASQSQ